MVLTRQQARTHKPVEENPPSTGNGYEHEGRSPKSRKKRGKRRAKTMSGGKGQRKRNETTKLSRLLDMPVDILNEVRGSLLYLRIP